MADVTWVSQKEFISRKGKYALLCCHPPNESSYEHHFHMDLQNIVTEIKIATGKYTL
jgi:hypothetical protein